MVEVGPFKINLLPLAPFGITEPNLYFSVHNFISYPENIMQEAYSSPKISQQLCFLLAVRFSHSLSGINRVRCNLCSFNSSWHSQSLKLKTHFKVSLLKQFRLWIESFHVLESPGFYVSFICFLFFLKWIPLNFLSVNLLSKIKHLKIFPSSFSRCE